MKPTPLEDATKEELLALILKSAAWMFRRAQLERDLTSLRIDAMHDQADALIAKGERENAKPMPTDWAGFSRRLKADLRRSEQLQRLWDECDRLMECGEYEPKAKATNG